ncbi:MAG: hypothetical protein RLZZ350_2056 [Verrucomicrobiota bacterium]|jgi:hypothetical protein
MSAGLFAAVSQCEPFFLTPSPLPLGEGVANAATRTFGYRSSHPAFSKNANASKLFPLPAGEGQGEGARVFFTDDQLLPLEFSV